MTPTAAKIVAHTDMDVELMSDSFQSGECCNCSSHETEETFFRSCDAPVPLSSVIQRLDPFPSAARSRYFSSDPYSRDAAICAIPNLEYRKFQLGMNIYMLYPIDLVITRKAWHGFTSHIASIQIGGWRRQMKRVRSYRLVLIAFSCSRYSGAIHFPERCARVATSRALSYSRVSLR